MKALLGGQKVPLTLVQRLWRLKDGQGELHSAQADDGHVILVCRRCMIVSIRLIRLVDHNGDVVMRLGSVTWQ